MVKSFPGRTISDFPIGTVKWPSGTSPFGCVLQGTAGFGAELSALVQERCFYHLEAPIERVTGFDTPYPHSLEWAYFPGPVRLGQALKRVMKD